MVKRAGAAAQKRGKKRSNRAEESHEKEARGTSSKASFGERWPPSCVWESGIRTRRASVKEVLDKHRACHSQKLRSRT